MKRDVDLCRQLLLDIENHGTDCSLSALRNGLAQEADERIRYHLRLLIDASFLKEIDRTSAGVPCVRITNSGQEFIELIRGEARWREAKWLVHEQSGGLSLTVLRALLTKWAVDGVTRGERYRRTQRPYRPYYVRTEPLRYEPTYRIDSYRVDREPTWEEENELRLMRSRPDYRERFEYPDHQYVERNGYAPYDVVLHDAPLGVTLPVSLV
jgi:hypothetical protein